MKYSGFLLIILFSSNSSVLSELNDSDLSDNIVYAVEVQQLPWFVPLEITVFNTKKEHRGNILSDEWILTSAFNLRNATVAKIFPGRTNMELRPAVTYESKEFYVHPDYNPNYLNVDANADLALIKLKAKLCFNKLVQPIKLHDVKLEDGAVLTIPIREKNVVTKQFTSKIWHYIELPVMSNEECSRLVNDVTDICLCVTSSPDNACDFLTPGVGAAVYYEGEKRLVGVLTFVSLSCDKNGPLGFTRLYPHLNWIKEITGV